MTRLVRYLIYTTILLAPRPAFALDPTRSLTQSVQRIWQVQQGLPQAWIYAVAQTADGYLWLGTQAGLVKFDGVRFTRPFQYTVDGIQSDGLWVTHVVDDGANGLWIATAQAGLIRLRDEAFTRFERPIGMPAGRIQCLVRDQEGRVWACVPGGLAEVGERGVQLHTIPDAGRSAGDVRAACVDTDGTIRAATDRGVWLAVGAGTAPANPLVMPEGAEVQALLCADGVVWVGTSRGLLHLAGDRAVWLAARDGLAADVVLTLARGRDGSVYAGTSSGFSRVLPSAAAMPGAMGAIDSFGPQDGLSQSTVYGLYEDRDGSLWVATKHGLNQFLDSRTLPYTTSEGLPSNNTGPVLQSRDGAVWVGTLDGGLARFDGGVFDTVTTGDGLVSNAILSLAEDAGGDLWVGTAAGLSRLHAGRPVGRWTTRDGLPANRVQALHAAADGTLWIATAGGPALFRQGRVQRVPDPRSSRAAEILAFGEDADGRVLALPDSIEPFSQADAMYRDPDGRIWIGTAGQGLRLLDHGRTVTFSVLDGLFDDVIYGIAEDDQGRLWMACSKGIFYVARGDLLAFAAGELPQFVSTPYSPLEGLRTVECQGGVQPVVTRAADGRLWFATVRGVIVIDPHHFERRIAPPAVTVEAVTVNGERRSAGDVRALPAGLNNVEFSYGAASLIAPARISFRYRLEGLDGDWVAAGARREAYYANLPPGRFRFRVEACAPDGVCAEGQRPVVFDIAPRIYQRWWFAIACVALLSAGSAGIYRFRIRRMQEQFDLVLTERGRIARELHDTLIQGFSGITMALQAMVSRLPSSEDRTRLAGIVEDAGQAMREARRSLMGLRGDDTTTGLASGIAQTAKQLVAGHHLKLRLSVHDAGVALPPEVEYHFLRIAQEAILNAVKHSGCRTLKVALERDGFVVRLAVIDDGVGFDGEPAPGHYGLIGMRERASQIGGHLVVDSGPGRGTAVSLTVPA